MPCLLGRVDEGGGSNGRAEAEAAGLYINVVGRDGLSLILALWRCMTVLITSYRGINGGVEENVL